MHAVGLLPALSLVAGSLAGLAWPSTAFPLIASAGCVAAAVLFYAVRWRRLATAALTAGFACCGATNAVNARERALDTPLRRALDAEFGGFDLRELGPPGFHAPQYVRARLTDDASPRDGFVSLSVNVRRLKLRGRWLETDGAVRVSVGGTAWQTAIQHWRAGRTIEIPVVFRRPARFLNDGVADFERDLALDGTTLLGSVKSGLLVEVVEHGTWLEEAAASARARIRRAISRWVGERDPISAGLVTAVLIGDRAAVPDDIRDRLQAAGTYHVIAISGGNIAVFVLLVSWLAALLGFGPRPAAALTFVVLAGYAAVVVSGPSVRRAVLVAFVYLLSRTLDHRAAAWHTAAIALAGLIVAWPLDLRDAGFVLTFGAAAALLATSPATERLSLPFAVRWLFVAIAASVAVEAALLPVQALVFGRVTLAGIVLNLLAVPAMTVAQCAGLMIVALDLCGLQAAIPASIGDHAVSAVVRSGALVDSAPWLAGVVRPPSWFVVSVYYAALATAVCLRGRSRAAAGTAVVLVAGFIVTGSAVAWTSPPPATGDFRVTILDVGQAEALLLQPPAGAPILVDTGGSAFGSGLDVGERVVAPALWARGVRSLSALLVTHGDPDHLGGAAGVLARLRPDEAWLGIDVPGHAPGEALAADLARRAIPVRALRAGDVIERGRLRLRVLHPPAPDWERRRVRNDDSVVLEAVYGDVAVLLLGDVSAAVERALVPQLTPARLRVLKVAHHGSQTSTSRDLLDAWRPQLALISAGRGNSFGHPARDVLERLDAIGATVLRTDRDGQITVTSDGRAVCWRAFMGPGSCLSPEP